MKKVNLFVISALVSAGVSAEDHFYMGPNATYQFWDKNRFVSGADDDNGVQLGLNLGYEFGATDSSKYAAEFSVQTSASDTNAEADEYAFNYYTYFSESSFGTTPYLVAGFSHIDMDRSVVIDQSTTNATLGLGISQYLGDFLELKYDMRFRTAIGDHATGQVHDFGFNVALNYHFGRSGKTTPVAAPAPAPVAAPAPAPARVAPAPRPQPAPAPQPVVRNVTVTLDVLFETNSSILQNLDDAEFQRMADALRENPDVTLTIEGHTDSAGSAEYNETLSQRRADRVKEALVTRYGAPENRIRSVGYGEDRPIADNATAAGRAQNRRVVGVISYQVSE